MALTLIGVFTWMVVYFILGQTAGPDGQLFQLIMLTLLAHIGGWLMSLTTLPALVGMLFTGVILQNIGMVDFDDSFKEVTKVLR